MVVCEVVDVVDTAIVCFCCRGTVVPGCGVPEDAVKCGSRCKWNGNMEREVHLAVRKTRCPVVGQCGVNSSNVCNLFVVPYGVELLGRGKVNDFSDPDIFTKLAYACVKRGKPGR